MSKRGARLVLIIATVLALTPATVFVIALTKPSFSRSIHEELQREGEGIVAAIMHFEARNGFYPETLQAAGVETILLSDSHNAWDYRLLRGGECQLSIGDYGEDGFCYFWTPSGGWSLDT